MQTILSVLLLGLITPELCLAYSYPIFGTKRFQRAPQYPAAPYQYPAYQAAAVPQYYNNGPDPYADETAAYYYQQQPRRENTGNMFGLPTYHGEYKPTPYYYAHGPSYSYTDDRDVVNSNPMDDLHEEMLQEDAMDRGEYGPIGQEIWYESPGHSSDSLAKANAAFLHNLMLYQRQFGGPKIQGTKDLEGPSSNNPSSNYDYEYEDHGSDWYDNPVVPNSLQETPVSAAAYHKNVISPSSSSNYNTDDDVDEPNSDKEVKELKALVNKHRKEHDSLYANHNDWNQKVAYSPAEYDDPEYEDAWINWDSKRSTAPKKVLPKKPTNVDSKKLLTKSVVKQNNKQSSTMTTTTTTQKPVVKIQTHNGQKEVVLPRPATPVKHPFQQPPFEAASVPQIMEAKKQLSSQKPHSSGAIYDTIKQILRMEQSLDKEQQHTQQKRFVSSEGSLVQELNTLKRHAA